MDVQDRDDVMSPLEVILDVFGGYEAIADALGLSIYTVLMWRYKREGRVPLRYFKDLLSEAGKRGLSLTSDDLVFGRSSKY